MYTPDKYWNKLLESKWDDSGVCWPNWPVSYNKWLHIQQYKGFEELLTKYDITLKGKRVCEIGPGTGFWTEQLQNKEVGFYKAFEISKFAVDKLKRRFNTFEFKCADFSEYVVNNEEKENFEFSLSVLVFLHITDNSRFRQCVENISKLVRPGAYMIALDAVSLNPLHGHFQNEGDTEKYNHSLHDKIRFLDEYISIYKDSSLELLGVHPAFALTQPAFDFSSHLLYKVFNFYFQGVLNPILSLKSEYIGNLFGKVLVNCDRRLFPLMRTGVSSKWFVFQKKY